MLRSMTGYGQADGLVGATRVNVDVRTVNHRFFSPSIKLPSSMTQWEADVRELMRQRIARGHASLTVRIDRSEAGGLTIDEERVASIATQLRQLCDRHALEGGVDLATVLRMPDVLVAAREELLDGSVEALTLVVRAALDQLDAARRDEGTRLTEVLRARLDEVDAAVGRIAIRAPERLLAHRERLRAHVQELAGGVAVNADRLAQEIAILADRMDVAEELDRFGSHLAAFRDTLNNQEGEPAGKRLGFLLQELLREANTTGSKAGDAEIAREVIGIKEELERLREQVENIE